MISAFEARSVSQTLIHTGQHYDALLSNVIFRDLGLPAPDADLDVGSGSHAAQTARLLVELEAAFERARPPLVITYGDVNSTLAAALVAAKLQLPSAHVEAGLRSFDRSMPEEINRLVTDALAELLFTTSPEARANLRHEGVPDERIHFVGNPMIDTLLAHRPRFDGAAIRGRLGVERPFAVVTLHRPANVDDPATVGRLVGALAAAAALVPLVIPLHPRGRAALEAAHLGAASGIVVLEPLGYLDFLSLVNDASIVITDSGGIQEETTILGIPCLTVRPNTERPITISHGTNRLVTIDGLEAAVRAILDGRFELPAEPPPLWDGHAGERIGDVVAAWLAAR